MKAVIDQVAAKTHWIVTTDAREYFPDLKLIFLMRGDRDVCFEVITGKDIKRQLSITFAVLTMPKDCTDWNVVNDIAKMISGEEIARKPETDLIAILREDNKFNMVVNALSGRGQSVESLN